MWCCYYVLLGRVSFVVGSWGCGSWSRILWINSLFCRCSYTSNMWCVHSSTICSGGMKSRIKYHRRCSVDVSVIYLSISSTINYNPRLLFLLLFDGKFKCSCSVLLSCGIAQVINIIKRTLTNPMDTDKVCGMNNNMGWFLK